MKNKVLYFPYINVPNSIWFTRMLLYWDEVGAIVPYDFIERPNRLDGHTRSLVQATLVKQVIPGEFLYKIPAYTASFVNYLESLGSKLEERRKSFKGLPRMRRTFKIHIEKMDDLGEIFVGMGLAKRKEYPWYEVEAETGKEFMAYLAATLGRLEDLLYIPITDELRHLEEFVFSSSPDLEPEKKISSIRLQLLEDLFPAPARPLHAQEIEEFKAKHGDKLSAFRFKVESELVNIADIDDEALCQRKMELFKEETMGAIREIKNYLNESGYNRLTLGKIGSVIAAIPGISGFFGLANAIYNAFQNPDEFSMDRSLLYAAYAQKEILQM
jgi:hypothetical protein